MKLPRYQSYRDSGVEWIGRVPSHWTLQRIKASVASSKNGVWGGEPTGSEDDVPCVRVADFDRQRLVVGSVIPTIRNVDSSERNGRVLQAGDLLLEKSGGGEKQPVGQVVQYCQSTPAICSNFVSRVTLRQGMVSRFWTYVHFAAYASRVNTRSIKQTSGIQNLDQEQYFNEVCAFPETAEQTAIAAFLDRETAKIDALIAEQERLIELLDEKRQAAISHAVTKGLNPDAPMKDSGVAWLGEVPAHWTVSPLKSLAKIGNGSTPNRDTSEYWAEEGFPWLNSSVVNQARVTESDQFVTQLALDQCHLPLIDPPAILVGITGQGKTRGMATSLGFKATVSQHVAYVKPRGGALLDSFLLRVFEAIYDHLRIESDGAGSTKGAITCEQIGNIRIPLPSIDEQATISAQLASELATMDKLGVEAEKAIALLSERRSALIAAAVTGQIDVREAS